MKELPKAYVAKQIDSKWYQFWLAGNFFKANPQSTKPSFCIVMPPPNVTGVLHMGHALVNTLQDILIRWRRMMGDEVLWVPGTDHAGIATQTVVEQHLIKTTSKGRKDYSREEFLVHIWEWKEKSESRILDQIKTLGCSCDWSRLRFTMDEGNNQAVRTIFKKLFEEGLIYRGDYLVNWDPITQTALADDEVEYEERQSFIWHLKYPLADDSGFLCIATTRPETMLGDTAIAVSPGDPRYSELIGKKVKLPLSNRLIPIIADHHVDPSFGTGVVKVTPAHDHNDYQMGITHRLPIINILTPDGFINSNGGEFEGLSILEAREAVVKKLASEGLLEKVEPHVNRVGISYRSKATIEPYLSKQWFIRMEGFAKYLSEAVTGGKMELVPSNWESTYFHWIDNLRDWCISRQLIWGHRIPIWYHIDDPQQLICHDGEGLPEEVQNNPEKWIQDPDVLDTWFSSALWPFSTLGWPQNTPELAKFYPNSVLVTGHDILFFWVARMMAMGEFALGQLPFPKTFLHGLIYGKSYWRDRPDGGISYVSNEERLAFDLGKSVPKDVHSKWEKMSKSKGNIIDPLEMIEEYGTDAVRMALCASATQARQIDLDRRRFEEFKNFTNKIWNGARFVLMNLNENEAQGLFALDYIQFLQGLDLSLLRLEDRWILSILNRTIKSVNQHLESYQFDQAALESYNFFWKEFCAYYVEISKPVLFGKTGTQFERVNKQKLLVIILCQAIRLMHPMAPFITEELFHLLKEHLQGIGNHKEENHSNIIDPYTKECITALKASACIVAPFPQCIQEDDIRQDVEDSFQLMEQIVYTIRNIRGEMNLSPGVATDVYIVGDNHDPVWQLIQENTFIISALIKTQTISVQSKEPSLGFVSTGVYGAIKIMIPLPEQMIQQEIQRLNKEKEKLILSLHKVEQQLSNEDFVNKAPTALIQKLKQQFSQGNLELEEMAKKITSLHGN